MLSQGIREKVKQGLGVLAALAVTLALAFWTDDGHAGTLAQLQLQFRAVKHPPRMDLCVGGARTPNCRAALEGALHAVTQTVALKSWPQSAHGFYSSGVTLSESREPLPVRFNTDPQWKKRAILIAHEGLTFLRMPQGGGRELTLGINRHGILGFSLKDSNGD
jgi:hypothetical protein